jgi:hypothetical protein
MSDVIKLNPSTPLPCGIIKGDTTCGEPATSARVVPATTLPGWQQLGLTSGEFVILPVCAECAQGMSKVYD